MLYICVLCVPKFLNAYLQLVDSVLKSLSSESHTLVSLNGLIHIDDNLALKSIIQQLQIDNLEGGLIEGSFGGLYYSIKFKTF